MKFPPSIEKGFYFKCQNCGNCCSLGWDGTVLLYKNDLIMLSEALKISLEELAEKFLATYNFEYYLWDENLEHVKDKEEKVIETPGFEMHIHKNCRFLKEHPEDPKKKICAIYPKWPFQCKSYPFWTIIMEDEKEFKKKHKECKGFVSKEDLLKEGLDPKDFYFTPEIVEKRVKEERLIEKEFCDEMKAHDFDLNKIMPWMKFCKERYSD